VYAFIYVLVPRFLVKKKYIAFFAFAIILLVLSTLADLFLDRVFLKIFSYNSAWIFDSLTSAVNNGFLIQFYICSIAVGIKFTKSWYLQQMENSRLAKQKTRNELNFFKNRYQPEFLFYSLSTLHNKLADGTDDSAEMILNLADIYSCILYDSSAEYVTIDNEILLLQNLLTVEKRCVNMEMETEISISGKSHDKYISPHILFSVLQKKLHLERTSGSHLKMITINITIKDEVLLFRLEIERCPGEISPFVKDYINNNIDNTNNSIINKNEQFIYHEYSDSVMEIELPLIIDEIEVYSSL
jgi:LytS/YehU family sensor histidine kinase